MASGFDNDVMFADNVDFSAGSPVEGKVTADGQLLIGATASPNIRVSTLTAGSGMTITNGEGSITLSAGTTVATTYTTDSGNAIPVANILNVLGGTGVETSGSGNTVTIDASAATPLSFPCDSGTATPAANALTLAGSGSITTTGSGSTATTALTGLTNHAVLVGAGTSTLTNVGPTATVGQVLQSAGAAADPAFSTATYPLTTTVSQILYSSAANTVVGLATALDGVLITSHTGVPSWLANGATGEVLTATTGAPPSWQAGGGGGVDSVSGTADRITSTGGADPILDIAATYVGQTSITTLGTVATGTWDGTDIAVAAGGTGNNTFTAYSVICAGTTATGAFQNVSGVGSSTQVLTSNGAGTLPTWQTPASGAGNWIKISSATASASATINFTGLTNTYSTYVVTISNLAPATDATTLWMRTSTDGGASYDAGASDYA